MFIVLPANGDQKELVLNAQRITWFGVEYSHFEKKHIIAFRFGDNELYWKYDDMKTRDQEYNRIKDMLMLNENY